jgi:NCS1 family nucleobase:cation symporter-1
VTIFGEAIWDPVALAGKMGGLGVVVALMALVVATLTTNLAANVVAPAYGFSNLNPKKISFKMGGYITAAIGIAIFPWKLMETAGGYLFVWLIGYSALLGPIAGILIADYFFVRKSELDADSLFNHEGIYKKWNWAGIIALIVGIAPNLPGFLHAAGIVESVPTIFDTLYSYAWFVGLFLAAIVYLVLNKNK